MRVVRINTTAWSEEDFYLETDLTIEQIEDVIKPIVLELRGRGNDYHNYNLTLALDKAYPNNHINHYMKLTTISI